MTLVSQATPSGRTGASPAFLRKIVVDPWLFGIFAVVTVSVLVFAALPIFTVLKQAVITDRGFDLAALAEVLSKSFVWESLFNTLLLGATSAVIATLIGFVLAFAATRTTMPGKTFVHGVALLPIISPPFVMALAVVILFGRSGLITRELLGIRNANVYGFHSLVLIQSLAFTPIAYLNIRGMLQSIDSALEDASASLGASRWVTFSRVTLPLVTPAILSSALLVFVKSVEDFGNPMLIGGNFNTLAVEAYSQMVGYFDLHSGALLASLMLVPSITAFLVHRYWVSKRSYVTVTGKPTAQTIRISGAAVVLPLSILCYAIVFAILLFYLTVIYVSFTRLPGIDNTLTFDHYATVFTSGFQTLANSLLLAGIATPVTAIAGMLIAYLLVRKAFPGSFLLRWGTLLSFAAPGTILGIGYVSTFNAPPLLLTGTAFIVVAAMVVKNLQVGIEAGSNQLRQIDKSIEEASMTLGASNTRTFFQITLPLLKPALFTSLSYAFTRSLTTLSAVIFLVSANWTLITVTILSQVETLKIGVAAAYCSILVFVVLAILALMQLLLSSTSPKR
ncbi:iron(III) transport system permease protein [Ensifer adhaerens]|uniref:Iron(III) transport system permease protein n=1 Tax=Ensifer adhaerens TaxID=106592 RepID=A0ACC5SRT5_ENSAD|nr:iron ABC transporter permease [Ensifer adhaerens]MBP1871572.1 iron(III) transport system permease protein [Ensifer adhaerens]